MSGNIYGLPRVLWAVSLVAVGCDAPSIDNRITVMYRGGPEHSGVYETRGVEQLGGTLWRFQTGGPIRSSPAVAGDVVFIGSTDGSLYALDRRNGRERWRFGVGSPVSSSPAVTHGSVIFGSRDGAFYAVDAHSGRLRWRFETGALIPWEWGFEGWDVYTASPVVVDTVVVFGAGDGVVYAVEALTGEQLWRFETGGRIRATPAIGERVVFAGSTDGRVYALELATGRELWRHETDGAGVRSEELGVDRKSLIASPAVAGGTVYIGSRDGYLYALDQQTGARKWRFSHDGSWAMSSPALTDEVVYSGTSDGRFVNAVAAGSGEELWRYVGIGYTWSSPCIAGHTLYIGDGGGYIRAIDRNTGLQRWSYRVPGGVYSSPVVDDGVVFFGAEDGGVYALHGAGQYPLRAVFWDEAFGEYTIFRSHLETKTYFEQVGYEPLDATALAAFLEARLVDRIPSVVVFAMDHLPAEAGTEPSDTTLLLRYLDSGGKVVWLGLPPMSLVRDESGRITAFDRGRPTALLGVDHSRFNFDFYASLPTELGHAWGLDRGWVSSYAVDTSSTVEVLGIDENGRAGAWLRQFGGSPGTGYVAMGLDHATPEILEFVLRVAEYGVVERDRD